MNWIFLTSEEQLTALRELSKSRPQVIFKHSTRCAASSLARHLLEKKDPPPGVDFYLLDLIKYRSLSDKIASDLAVHHESPQVLLIRNMECVYDESHNAIRMEDIIEQLH